MLKKSNPRLSKKIYNNYVVDLNIDLLIIFICKYIFFYLIISLNVARKK